MPKLDGNVVNACIETKSIFIETGGCEYALTTNNWPINSAIGSQTGYVEWEGVEGRAVELTCSSNESKLITALT